MCNKYFLYNYYLIKNKTRYGSKIDQCMKYKKILLQRWIV